ncbi:MAG: ribosome assembly cofactor RimP [Spirochaetales bacterium]|nr:ribosome assembly cofactor RimP [Spirochaetales bacterium]
MLRKGIQETPLFVTFDPLIRAVNLRLVDISVFESRKHVGVNLVIMAENRDTTVEDCATVHKIVAPRLNLLYDTREVGIEVSTPGLQRNLKDVHEFTLYEGKRVRIYSTVLKGWISGRIETVREDSLTVRDVIVEDTNEQLECKSVEFDEIQKAKLEYRWEDRPHGN